MDRLTRKTIRGLTESAASIVEWAQVHAENDPNSPGWIEAELRDIRKSLNAVADDLRV